MRNVHVDVRLAVANLQVGGKRALLSSELLSQESIDVFELLNCQKLGPPAPVRISITLHVPCARLWHTVHYSEAMCTCTVSRGVLLLLVRRPAQEPISLRPGKEEARRELEWHVGGPSHGIPGRRPPQESQVLLGCAGALVGFGKKGVCVFINPWQEQRS